MSQSTDDSGIWVGDGDVRNCPFAYRCDKRWENLTTTENPRIRHCDACELPVYLCRTREELTRAIFARQCIALRFYTTETVPPVQGRHGGTQHYVQRQTLGLHVPPTGAGKECGIHPGNFPKDADEGED